MIQDKEDESSSIAGTFQILENIHRQEVCIQPFKNSKWEIYGHGIGLM